MSALRRPPPLAVVAVVALAVLMLVPMLWVLILSFKDNTALLADTASAFVPPYTFANYRNIMGEGQVFTWLMNSVIVSLAMTAGVLIVSSLAGYGFARLEFPGRKILFVVVLFGLAIPEQAVIIGRHQIFSALSMHNSYTALVVPGLSMPFGVFLMTQYFRAIPVEIDEAAMLDGASRFRIFWRILLPLTIPAQATLGIFTFFQAWNDYWWPLISATDGQMYTLTVGIAATQVNFAQAEGLGFLMAQAVFAGLPTLIVYLIFQKYIVRAVAGAAGQ
ncbi:MAG: carbohydrate ABC transporter permease [Alphaproteobacteria bacterium]|nr:carbohydrate ABC transporter permease [Alphaproteobacteria bacterium]MBU0793651.1 carbohydrate ABC transporter permease [Alphaproteobacteria bacterium]MBU0877716.1 carbohydrate ABC transporter permease [Alphaproteobacteria bacterium]MBU1771172.1 carbohydrate ABC transporter permease [Alphaproteobacteria bacterium]